MGLYVLELLLNVGTWDLSVLEPSLRIVGEGMEPSLRIFEKGGNFTLMILEK